MFARTARQLARNGRRFSGRAGARVNAAGGRRGGKARFVLDGLSSATGF